MFILFLCLYLFAFNLLLSNSTCSYFHPTTLYFLLAHHLINNINSYSIQHYQGSATGDQNGSNSDSKSKSNVVECFYGASIPLSQSVRTWRFWSLYVAFLTICGTGLMVIDNINAIAEAVGRHPSDFFVALVFYG